MTLAFNTGSIYLDSTLVADDHAVSARAGDGRVILFKERNRELRQTHRNLQRPTGDVGGKFTGDECLLCAGSHAGRDNITVIESEIRVGLTLIIRGIDVRDQIYVLGAGNKDRHLSCIANANDAGVGSSAADRSRQSDATVRQIRR